MYTCLTCHVAFQQPDLQKDHYKTDWHRYNLKRKVAEYPPVKFEEFQARVLQAKAENSAAVDLGLFCKSCKKGFKNQKSYDNHLNSYKHRENEARNGAVEPVSRQSSQRIEDVEVEEVDSDEWEASVENPIEHNNCLFCSHHSRNFTNNLNHMMTVHSFFIPDLEYCTDVQGLLSYLSEKIFSGFICIWCNDRGKAFHSAEAVQNHMLDKGHCKMLHEGEALLEYSDYFDFSSSYPTEGADDEEVEPVELLEDTDFQLVLPSGATIGHRSLMRYYKQNLNVNTVVAPKNTNRIHKIMSQYKSIGWVSTQTEVARRKARDLRYMHKAQAKYNTALGVKANKLQKHFRPQVNF